MTVKGLNIAVIGSGISGLSSAWLLSKQHNVTLFEKDDRFGGHSNTVMVKDGDQSIPVDTGFIVFNKKTYPNLTALFDHLDVPVVDTDMSFAVSMDDGRTEYSGTDLNGLFAQRINLLKPGFLRMLLDIFRFYQASNDLMKQLNPSVTLRELLSGRGYSQRFIDDHLVPMGAAIWSTPSDRMLDYPALAFMRFCQNHGLLQLTDRPQWQTVKGGSKEYVQRLLADMDGLAVKNRCVRKVKRHGDRVVITDLQGDTHEFDHVVMACHADTSLAMLSEPDELEQLLLGAFSFQRNRAILHSDERLMPSRKRAWASWNYFGTHSGEGPSLTYWMNRLQHLEGPPLFVTLNPSIEPEKIHGCYLYDHPVFDRNALEAQSRLWELQGRNRTWFCGAWFGYGFHEDGLQSGLAVAEALGGKKRPWSVENQNDRLVWPEHGIGKRPVTSGMELVHEIY
ncbi:NAD(P)/FAD-dependent oxidoreductase [Endozoicomonas arenosclerae]|uniref:NAD(P)/FAD-dependent oxidoreductase n=1 Tax=Endozoicomonas arenosclerae TaxID=1633495 RepID=UPI000784A5D6|nr:FAD-dependent oxidoreductase [Endozoicomonas arenosclerae]